jgi:hypothetical protein
MDFFERVQWTHLTMVPKMNPKGLLSYIYQKNFSPKNQSAHDLILTKS